MRAVQVQAYGGPEVLVAAEVADPVAGPGELLVRVAASGVNYIDTYHRTGVYPVPLPFTPGLEGAGEVVAVGDGVTEFGVGARVAWASAIGSYAELAAVPASAVVPVPDGVDLVVAASSMLQGMTAHYLTTSTYPVQAGDDVLVHAAAGGMGLLLTQFVKAKGGRVIGTVSTAEKEKLAREAGADEIIRYTEADVAEQARALTGGRGVAVVYDGVGATTFDASLASLRPRGVLALYGAASGQVPPVDLQRLNQAGSVYVTRPSLGHYTANREELLWRSAEVLSGVADGSLNIRVGARYALSEARQAHEDLQGRRTTGKVLLVG
ncbi:MULTISPECIES: quinone oxidoreductase [unclassified Crossiella]|uniref:quinone oxidoreductase family protein n=1 Tax=unclassified Crossiella TaxID=2620835 RepID=UPI0020002068|nr:MULTISPECIES: quinone oxidoreductase [unclassified Crossiella]MCK2242623.1 quinone oxidoreductase [Crossiella sp. S99.2]MCK2256500.1 quinone oxidoreductase [Crossiella sp. S99.1]